MPTISKGKTTLLHERIARHPARWKFAFDLWIEWVCKVGQTLPGGYKSASPLFARGGAGTIGFNGRLPMSACGRAG